MLPVPAALTASARIATRQWSWVLAGLVMVLLPTVAVAQTPLFTLRQWTTADGLPASTINGIAEGPRGDLWLATTGGLAVFDGQQFRVLGPDDGLTSNRFLSVYVDRRGRVLAGSGNGRLFASEGARFVEIARGLVVRAIGETADGALWAANSVNAARLTPDGRWTDHRPVTTIDDVPGLVRFARGTVVAMYEAESRVLQPSRGEVFGFRRTTGRVVVGDGGTAGWSVPATPQPELRLIDRAGRLWVTGDGNLRAFVAGQREPVARVSLPEPLDVTAAAETSDGLLWFGTDTGGLFRVQRSVARIYGRSEGATDDQIRFIGERPDGRVALRDAAGTSLVVSPDGARLTRDTTAGYWFTDSAGVEWSLDAAFEPTAVRSPGSTHRFPGAMPGRPRLATDGRRPTRIWMGGIDWVARFAPDANRADPFVEVHRGLTGVVALVLSSSGSLVVLSEGGLLEIRDGNIVTLVERDRLPPGDLRTICEDSQGMWWVGSYGGGLARIDGREVRRLTERDGLAEDIVSAIVEDGHRGLWLAGNRGISRLTLDDATEVFDGTAARVYPVLLTRLNDLRNPETSGWPALRASDGRLWFPTLGGAVVVDPRVATDADTTPPRLWIDRVIANGTPLSAETHHIPPGDRRVEWQYTGISLPAAEQVRYQYRIDGVDREWIDAGTSRTATYSSLPPGTLTFRVRATRGGGQWSVPDTTAVVVVEPFLWETAWFRVVAGLLLVGLTVGGARYRVINLRRRAEHLQHLVDARTAELRAQQQVVAAQATELDELNRAKSRFFANISHEFRTPLTLIQGPLDDLLAGAHGRLSDTARGLLRLSVSNTRRVLQLVDQMLDLAKADSGRLRLQSREIDLRGFVLTMCEAFDAAAAQAGLVFRVVVPSGPLMAWVDPDHLEKILVNLIGNAIKYTGGGGSVEVELRVDDGTTAAAAELRVSDTGDGIPEADVPRVFERYYRAAHSSARRPGTGIGLALVKELVELHRGTISLASRVGTGSTFTVQLPLGRAHLSAEDIGANDGNAVDLTSAVPAMSDIPQESARTGDLMTLVVADDSADIREYLRASLAGRFEILEAEDGAAALALVQARVPDLVVSDVMMPGMDGFDLCRAIKGHPETEFTPVILLTARTSADSRVEGLGVGADDYLVKPFNMRELTARINNLIESRKRWRAKLEPAPAPKGASADAEFAARLRAAIEARISEEGLVAETLAADMAMSRATFYRRVEQVMGQSPADLVWAVRLERAATLLAERAGTVAEIAYGLGFTSLSHFSRRFRDKFNISPSAWRRGPL